MLTTCLLFTVKVVPYFQTDEKYFQQIFKNVIVISETENCESGSYGAEVPSTTASVQNFSA